MTGPWLIHEDEYFRLEQCPACPVPGYLILRIKSGCTSLGELPPAQSTALSGLLPRAVRAVERATGADRVYLLSFGEVDRRLHFHLFPRTAWVRDAFFAACPGQGEPVDGPALFCWIRQPGVAASLHPPASQELTVVLNSLRKLFQEEAR